SSDLVPSFSAIRLNASSQLASTKESFLRINGFVKRPSALIKSQPNFPFTQVDIAFTGPSLGSTLRLSRPFVHTSIEQPTPQNVLTVFVFFVLVYRIAATISDTAKIPLYPGSIHLTRSIIGSNTSGFIPVINPALPNIDFSINALQGQTETH